MTLDSGLQREGVHFQGIQVETQSPYQRGPGIFRRSILPVRFLFLFCFICSLLRLYMPSFPGYSHSPFRAVMRASFVLKASRC